MAQTVSLNLTHYLSQAPKPITQDTFRPLHLRSLGYDTIRNNFRLLLDKGDLKNSNNSELETTTKTLLNYFFVGITLPNDSFWVNLRPDSENNIIDPYLATTDVGKILLEQDLQLKKDTAGFTSPQIPEGREYWDKLYQKAGELFASENITIPTLTRPWIVPGEIIIRETKDNAYIYKATLKVMLEQDYLKDSTAYKFDDPRLKTLNEYSSQLIRELIIPKLTKEINTSQRYAPLRQVYYSLILAQWFKSRFRDKGGLYSRLIDKRNLNGLTSQEPWSKTAYFKAYQKSFKDGEYTLKEPIATPSGQTVRSYFSGGIDGHIPMSASLPQPGVPAVARDGSTIVTTILGDAKHTPLSDQSKVIGVKADGGLAGNPEIVNIEVVEEAPPSSLPAGGSQSGASSAVSNLAYPTLESIRLDVERIFKSFLEIMPQSKITVQKGNNVPLFVSMLEGDPAIDRLDSLKVSVINEEGGIVAQIVLYDGRSIGVNTLLLGRLFFHDLTAEKVLVTQSYVTAHFNYKEAQNGLEQLKALLRKFLTDRNHSVNFENEEVVLRLAKASVGLTDTEITEALETIGTASVISETGVIDVLDGLPRKLYPSQNYPSIEASTYLLRSMYQNIAALAIKMGYSSLTAYLSFPDGFQNYLLYSRVGFRPTFTQKDQRDYFTRISAAFKENKERGMSNKDATWDLRLHFDSKLIPVTLDLYQDNAQALQFFESLNFRLLSINSLARRLRQSKTISSVEEIRINKFSQYLKRSLSGKFVTAKNSYAFTWINSLFSFLVHLADSEPTLESINRLNHSIEFGNIFSNIPDVYFRVLSEEQITIIVNNILAYLGQEISKNDLLEKIVILSGGDFAFAEKLLKQLLFLQDETRLKITYRTVVKGERTFEVTGVAADGNSLGQFLGENSTHTFSPKEFQEFLITFMIPPDLYKAIRGASGQPRIVFHIGRADEAYIRQLDARGFIRHAFRKGDHEKSYRNRTLYYRIGSEGQVEIEFFNIVGMGNLKNLIEFYLTIVNKVTVIDHMPNYDQMISSLAARSPPRFAINIIGVGTGWGMGTYIPDRFGFFMIAIMIPSPMRKIQVLIFLGF